MLKTLVKNLFPPKLHLDNYKKFIIKCNKQNCIGRLKKHGVVVEDKESIFFCSNCGSMHTIIVKESIFRGMTYDFVSL